MNNNWNGYFTKHVTVYCHWCKTHYITLPIDMHLFDYQSFQWMLSGCVFSDSHCSPFLLHSTLQITIFIAFQSANNINTWPYTSVEELCIFYQYLYARSSVIFMSSSEYELIRWQANSSTHQFVDTPIRGHPFVDTNLTDSLTQFIEGPVSSLTRSSRGGSIRWQVYGTGG